MLWPARNYYLNTGTASRNIILVSPVEVTAATSIRLDSDHHILPLLPTSFNQLGILFSHDNIANKNMF